MRVRVCPLERNCVRLYPLCRSSGWRPHGAQGRRSRSAARRWRERTELCRSPWSPSDQICENIIVSEILEESCFTTRRVRLRSESYHLFDGFYGNISNINHPRCGTESELAHTAPLHELTPTPAMNTRWR